MFLISDLCGLTDTYLEPAQVKEVYRAYLFGAKAHEGQHRASGEPYITHPVQVARILAEMRLDHQSVIAALLHDVIEDTGVGKAEVAEAFGPEVADLVDGVSKLTQISFETRAEAQAENLRKMMLAMARDIRVILVKLADRLHNMRTLDALRPDKRRAIARETLEIYAPIANRLGLNNIRLELEEIGFSTLYPVRHRVLTAQIKRARGHRKQVVRKIENAMKRRLRQEKLPAKVAGREKHPYSLYRKMRAKGVSFSEVFDVYGFRLNVETVDACYRALGIMHNLYKPVPGRFKDYIALPKANGYQSLHTVLFGPFGAPIEIQIRTDEMHAVAESGVAAHWMYKTGEARASTAEQHARQWLQELLEMQQHAGDSLEFIENVKVDLFPRDVYVFTPAGDIRQLPRGASSVDLAYAVHTDIGNTCIAAKIDGRYAPLRTPLVSGQTVEVITAPWGRPNANWLNFVVTGKARTNIRNYLKNLRTEEALDLGQRMLSQALTNESLTLDQIPAERIEALAAEFGLAGSDALIEDIGLGRRLAPLVARRLAHDEDEEHPDRKRAAAGGDGKKRPLYIRGSEGMVVSFARCCHPIPGDPVLGFVSAGRGIVIHATNCRNLGGYADNPENWIEVEWQRDIEGEFPVEIRVDMANRRGVLAVVAAGLAELGANIENVSVHNRDGVDSTLNFVIGVHDRVHLARILRRVRRIPEVSRVSRVRS